MRKPDLFALFAIAAIAVFLGMKLAGSLQFETASVDVILLQDFDDFEKRQAEFVKSGEVTQEDEKDIVSSTNEDIYLEARQWEWYPHLELQSGREYRLHIASSDIQHSFHLEKGATGQMIDVLIQPGKEYVINLTNLKTGVYAIGCTEYCGIQHNKMRGILIVR